MNRLIACILLLGCTSWAMAQMNAVNNSTFEFNPNTAVDLSGKPGKKDPGLAAGAFFGGITPCIGWWRSGSPSSDPDFSSRSGNTNIGLSASGDYFVNDNLSVGASIGWFRSKQRFLSTSFGNETEDKFLDNSADLGLHANYYWDDCLCGGGPVDPDIRPFVGVNAQLGVGRGRQERTNLETRLTNVTTIGASLSAGVLVRLAKQNYISFEGNLLSLNRRRSTLRDSDFELSNNNNFGFLFNKSLFSVNFMRNLTAE